MQEFFITAVDIGTHKISASIGVSRKNEDVEILGSSCVNVRGVENGVISNEDKCRIYFEEALSKLEEETGKKINDIYIGLPSNNIKCFEVPAQIMLEDTVKAKDVKRIIDEVRNKIKVEEGYEICDIVINYYKLDGKINLNTVVGQEGVILELNLSVIQGKTEVLDTYRRLCKGTKYSIKGFLVNQISLRKIFLSESILRENTTLVEIGDALTEISVVEDKGLKELMSIPLGGRNITSDLSICMALPLFEAEGIKREFSSIYRSSINDKGNKEVQVRNKQVDKELFYKVCEARIEEILNYVKNQLKKTGHYDDICSIILLGDAITNFEGINEVVHQKFKDKKIKIVTKNDFGMQNISNITSLAIVKEVHDRLELIYEEALNFTQEFKIKKTDENAYKKDKEELQKRESENKSIIRKFKNFLGDMF
ncbi:cell division FtsA domain-containing protein [Clostridium thermobutyricum]|uniref:Cell division protein FtsA n=1 Tax=Clostridium thermobutyricum DSM 4928 TaxID=1121339 RepID=A0A1V4SZF0_9CLOT|nr:cell division FtsA domain-containing protein [Clostridium thermobutyricum]OPX51312.1 cell division protein FtsA [Clostridium thermobutyricum DSM 4928]